jgi:hypothetical protein
VGSRSDTIGDAGGYIHSHSIRYGHANANANANADAEGRDAIDRSEAIHGLEQLQHAGLLR